MIVTASVMTKTFVVMDNASFIFGYAPPWSGMRGAAAVLCGYLEVRSFTCCGYPTVAHFFVIAPKRLGRVRGAAGMAAQHFRHISMVFD